jgi:hypothetical protein
MKKSPFSNGFRHRGLLPALALMFCFSRAALGANAISGSVRNQSRGEPAGGDDVVLVRLDGEMQEESRAKTDAQGAFTLNVQSPDKPYLVRLIHQGVGYDQQATVGQSLSIEVFDAAPEVRGIAGTIEILRTGTKGKLLHISDMIAIKNASNPPLTQTGERTPRILARHGFVEFFKPRSVGVEGPGREQPRQGENRHDLKFPAQEYGPRSARRL